MRGYFVLVMTIDHLGTFPAWTIVFTGDTQLWVSAAEGFVLISGILLGLLYRRRIDEKGWRWSRWHIGRRTAVLYALGVVGQIILTTGDYLLRLFRGRASGLPTNYLELVENALFQIRDPFRGVDLLPLYAVLLPCGLAALYLIKNGKWRWALAGSILIWYVARLDPSVLNIFRLTFRPAIWQLLFIIGVMAGYYQEQLRYRWRHPPIPRGLASLLLISSAAALLVISYQVAYNHLWPDVEWLSFRGSLFNRGMLGVGRIVVSIWVFAGMYELATLIWVPLKRLIGWLLIPLGQKSLIAYIVQAFLTYAVTRLPGFPFPDHDPTLMGFLHLAAVLAVWFATGFIARLMPKVRRWIQLHGSALAKTT